jgi:adenosylmethionine---8-amino-7-oxononanoate aminotransferase
MQVNHRRLKQLDRSFVWHPFTQMKEWDDPLVIDRAKGVYLYDADGKKYIDGVSSLWVNVHGHSHPTIDRAIKKQIDKLSHSTLLGLANTPSVELAAELIKIAPKGLSKVFYSDNGSTAVEVALKMSYQYWQNTGHMKKRTLVHLSNSYHGDTLGSVSVGGIDIFHKVYRGLIFKTHALKGQGFDAAKEFEKYLKKHANKTAALVVEPIVQGAAGMLMWPKGVLKEFRRLCTKYDVFLIVDEVATGFGRTGKMFACQHEGVVPDFMCVAKGITGGYLPLAATLTTQKVYDGFLFDYNKLKTFFHGHTYTGNPLACVAALANLDVFKKERTLAKLAPKIKYLAKNLKMFYNLPSVMDVRQCGFMVGIELKGNWQKRLGARVCQKARDYGVILRPLGNVIVIMPPLSISYKEIDQLLNATYKAIEIGDTHHNPN